MTVCATCGHEKEKHHYSFCNDWGPDNKACNCTKFVSGVPVTDKVTRRPCYERALRRRHLMPLDPPTETEKQDAILVLKDTWIWADEITEEALHILDEAGQ